ncbi:MAG TPA: NAD(P)/FAD-dependent oxidoreductase [Verrucomicrobiae bacterium]|jgi:phytoene dehydrogenase-like protein
MPEKIYDAVVVGSGANGLASAIRLAQRGLSVVVLEANDTVGGCVRSAELTLPGFVHDICSAVHPLAIASPFFKTLPLQAHGLDWIHPTAPLAHPLDGGEAVFLRQSLQDTARDLQEDASAYEELFAPLVRRWEALKYEILQPAIHIPKHPIAATRFALRALQSAKSLATRHFKSARARALFAGLAAHSFLPLESAGSAAFGLVLGMAGHAEGWPSPQGGAQQLTNALASYFRSLGGEIQVGRRIRGVGELPPAKAILLDLTVWQAAAICKDRFPVRYRSHLEQFPAGPAVFKIDYALSQPIPWRAPECLRAGTVHLGGTFEEVQASEHQVAKGAIPAQPFVLLAQPSLFDTCRAPPGKHTAWAYCHVPLRSTVDMTGWIERQIERFAPGFRDCVLARATANCAKLEFKNANLAGGSINGGAMDLWHLLARPVLSRCPYRTPARGIYLCSSSTPPGGGVHGMCGFHAAEAALDDIFS